MQRMKFLVRAVTPLMFATAVAIPAFAQQSASTLGPDVTGGKDAALVSRFAGSQLVGFQDLGFGQGRFYRPGSSDTAHELDLEKPVTVEGAVTRRLYIAPIGKSPLEVHRNF